MADAAARAAARRTNGPRRTGESARRRPGDQRTGSPAPADSGGPAAAVRRGGGGGAAARRPAAAPIPAQDAAQVSTDWPAGNIDLRMANYMLQAQQKWTIAPVTNAGGYPGSPYFKITIAGTDRALAATEDDELVVLPAFTGGPEQLWRIEQLADGTWRIMPKSVPNSKEAAGAFGRRQQFRHAGQVRSRQRQATLVYQGAMKTHREPESIATNSKPS